MVCDGYVKYEEAEVHRSAIMQDFQDKNFKWPTVGHDFISAKFVMGYPYVRTYIFLYSWSSYFAFFLSFLELKFLAHKS